MSSDKLGNESDIAINTKKKKEGEEYSYVHICPIFMDIRLLKPPIILRVTMPSVVKVHLTDSWLQWWCVGLSKLYFKILTNHIYVCPHCRLLKFKTLVLIISSL